MHQRIGIAFVDNYNLFQNKSNYEEKINEVVQKFAKYYKTSRGLINSKKSRSFC
jgi:hypothetical protein